MAQISMIILPLIVVLCLTACQDASVTMDSHADTTSPDVAAQNLKADQPSMQASAAAHEAEIRALLNRIYQSYQMNGVNFTDLTDFQTHELEQLISEALAGDPTIIGVDPYCDCQDFVDVRYEITAVRVDGDHATGEVDFHNFGEPTT